MRLIDADALLQHKRKMSGADFGGEFWDEAVLVSDIENAPTVDATLVVRCKDCIWFAPNCDGCWVGCAIAINSKEDEPKENDFCSFGERRGE